MLALWVLPAHHLQREQNKQNLGLGHLWGVTTANTLLEFPHEASKIYSLRLVFASMTSHLWTRNINEGFDKWESPSARRNHRTVFAVSFTSKLETEFSKKPQRLLNQKLNQNHETEFSKKKNSEATESVQVKMFDDELTLHNRGCSDSAATNKTRLCFVIVRPCLKC